MQLDYEDLLKRIGLQEGGLVEVWALDTDFQRWVAVIDGLQSLGYEMTLQVGETLTRPVLSSDMFDDKDEFYGLSISVAGRSWTSALSAVEVIDFQGSPRDIKTAADIDAIYAFMTDVSRLSDSSVVFIPETISLEGVRRYIEVSPG